MDNKYSPSIQFSAKQLTKITIHPFSEFHKHMETRKKILQSLQIPFNGIAQRISESQSIYKNLYQNCMSINMLKTINAFALSENISKAFTHHDYQIFYKNITTITSLNLGSQLNQLHLQLEQYKTISKKGIIIQESVRSMIFDIPFGKVSYDSWCSVIPHELLIYKWQILIFLIFLLPEIYFSESNIEIVWCILLALKEPIEQCIKNKKKKEY